MNKGEMQSMMPEMMEKMFSGMTADDKKEMMMGMMAKMKEGIDMKEMMPKMMMGMMSGGAGDGPGEMQGMMGKMMQGGAEQQMPEMMLKMMMPHCIGMMLPAIDPSKRGEVAAAILSAIVKKGAVDMSDEQKRSFLRALEEALAPSTRSTSDEHGDRPHAMSNAIAQTISNPNRLQNFERNSRTLASAQPAVMKAFWGLHKATMAAGALDTKTKELIALAISVSARCDDCIAHHTNDALEAGATREEIADALGVAILMSGGTGVVYATHAIEAVDQFVERAS